MKTSVVAAAAFRQNHVVRDAVITDYKYHLIPIFRVLFDTIVVYNYLGSKSTRITIRTFTDFPFFRPGEIHVGIAFTSRTASSLKLR